MHTVLLVDDEIFARKGLRNLIDWESFGFQVIDEADNGEDALLLIERIKPDLVITDIRMPVLDGLELIRKTVDSEAVKPSFIIISGYDDFKYAQQAVRYGVYDFILKPIDENVLEPALAKLNKKLQHEKLLVSKREQLINDEIITSLIKGNVNESTTTELSQRLGVKQGSDIFYVLVEINDSHPWQSEQQMTLELIKSHINEAFKSITKADKPLHLYEHRNQLGFLLSIEELDLFQGKVEHFAKRFQRYLSDDTNQTIYVYVGKKVTNITELSDSFRTAKEALQYKFIEHGNQVLIYDQIQGLSLNYVDMDEAIYQQLMEHIEEDNKEVIIQTIELIFKDFEKRRFAPEAVKLTIHHCVSGIIKIIKSMHISEDELATLEPIISWQDLNISPKELKRLFTDFMLESAQLLTKYRKEHISGGIQKIKSYIEKHYDENINLKSIAGKFYMNPVYLGQLFKKVHGVLFNDFLLQLRINEAKKLLRQTDLRIYEVAEKVGFSNADYFVTQFSKIEHMTPTEYRNKLLERK